MIKEEFQELYSELSDLDRVKWAQNNREELTELLLDVPQQTEDGNEMWQFTREELIGELKRRKITAYDLGIDEEIDEARTWLEKAIRD